MTLINSKDGSNLLSKVPEVTALFWLVKVMGTTVGETSADFLTINLNLGLPLTTLIMAVFLAAAFCLQFLSKAYTPWKYWLTVILVSVVGTLITDNLTDNLQVPLTVSTLVFGGLLILTLSLWYASERTLSIHSILTRKRELFYWATILFTFALGTAGGDLLSEKINLGYAVSGLIFAGAIALIAVAYKFFKLDSIWAFWMAYILTRPLGASLGDLMIQPRDASGLGFGSSGGLGLGLGPVNLAFFLCILAAVIIMTVRGRGTLKKLE